MGLDMYLYKKHYLWEKERRRLKITGITPSIKPERIERIIENIGYWRKANAIHKWFVDHVQEGEDDCKDYYVERDQLRDLLKLVKRVLQNHELAPSLLPTQEGFFFGDTEYGKYYFQDLEETRRILEQALSEGAEGEIHYQSSW